ncbi:MAG: helix-turn-helix domain-containing protein [Bacteroidia bacterium]
MKNIKPIHTEKDYRTALKRIDELIAEDPKEGTASFDELDIISTLVEAYENEHYPIEAPNAVEAIKYIMTEKGMSQKDLVRYFGGNKGLVSAVLSGKRELSKRIIKSLHDGLGIPYEILMA